MSLGQQFREARERKGVTLAKAAEDTKIKSETLRALEADDYSSMPPPVYVRGFVKMYAQYLGLDSQAARQEYEKLVAATPTQAESPLRETATHLRASPVDRILSSVTTLWRMWLLLAGIIVVLGLIIWVVLSATRQTARAQRSAEAVPPPATTTIAPSRTPSPTLPSPATTTVAPKTEPGAYIKPAQPRPSVLDPARTNVAPKTPSTPPPPAAAPLTLSIRLIEDCWIEVEVDGKTFPYRVQKAGWEKEWRATHSITLKAGNAAAVKARLNGQDLPPLGKAGQRITKTFSR